MIRNATLIGALSLALMSPLAARAQTAQPPDVTLPSPASGEGWSFHPSHWVAVGAGVVVGAVATEILIPTNLIYVAGGVVGGYIANAWYNGRQVEVRTVP